MEQKGDFTDVMRYAVIMEIESCHQLYKEWKEGHSDRLNPGHKRKGGQGLSYKTMKDSDKSLKGPKTEKDIFQKPQKAKQVVKTFKTEGERRSTFSHWPKEGFPSTDELARAGFEHTPYEGGPDCVYCERCEKYVEDWEPGDEPTEYHETSCEFHKKDNQRRLGCEMQLSPDQHAALRQYNESWSLMMKSAIKSEFRSMKKEIQDQFDELKREIQETKGSWGQLSQQDIDDIINKYDPTDERDDHNCAAVIDSSPTVNTEPPAQLQDVITETQDETAANLDSVDSAFN